MSTTARLDRAPESAAYDATHQPRINTPFRGLTDKKDTTSIPSFSKYRSSGGESTGKVFQYFMVGTLGAVTALGAKNTVQGMYSSVLSQQQCLRDSKTKILPRLPRQHVGIKGRPRAG